MCFLGDVRHAVWHQRAVGEAEGVHHSSVGKHLLQASGDFIDELSPCLRALLTLSLFFDLVALGVEVWLVGSCQACRCGTTLTPGALGFLEANKHRLQHGRSVQ